MKKSSEKVAIITGGSKRLGREITLSLANVGFNVVINYNHSIKEAEALVDLLHKNNFNAISVKGDVSNYRDVNRLINKSVKEFGRIDLLVNNASIFLSSKMESTTEKLWDKTLDVNLKGTFFCCQAVAPIMLRQKEGSIINISSIGGILGWINYYPYSISKGGVIMLTKMLARTLAPYICVNAIAPGYIDIKYPNKTETKRMPKKNIPLRRYGEVKDITDMVIFLATKSKYITGQVIAIDGGRSINIV